MEINWKFKTAFCRYSKERCLFGDMCQFAHGSHELRNPSCPLDLELRQKLATRLLILNREERFNENNLKRPLIADKSMEKSDNNPNPRFKTAICINFKMKGICPYGDLCQFAHGIEELRLRDPNKYKTKHCPNYWIAGYCPYGPRCIFIHQEKENRKSGEASSIAKKRAPSPSHKPMKSNSESKLKAFSQLQGQELPLPSVRCSKLPFEMFRERLKEAKKKIDGLLPSTPSFSCSELQCEDRFKEMKKNINGILSSLYSSYIIACHLSHRNEEMTSATTQTDEFHSKADNKEKLFDEVKTAIANGFVKELDLNEFLTKRLVWDLHYNNQGKL